MRKRPGGDQPFRLFLFVLALAFLTTSGTAYADGPWLPHNISTLGERIDHLWRVIFVLVTIMFVLTEGALIFFIFRYRRRPDRKASYTHENNTVEVVWSVIPALILIFISVYQWSAWADARLRPPDENDAVRVQIMARQFEWHVRYPGPDNVFATDDDVTLTNQLYIPEHRPILIQLRAQDVIHSFFLPNLRVKQDVVPGQTVQVWFDATETGDFEIACAELCGLGHYRMRGRLYIRSADEFQTWLDEKYESGIAPKDWGWDWKEGT